jgi:hypothetical protein
MHHLINEGYDPEEFGRNRQEGDGPCESGTAQEKLHREKPAQGNRHRREPHQGQGRARNPKNVGAQEEILDTPDRQNWTRGITRRILRRATEHQMLEFVEGSTPSEGQEVMAQEEPGLGSPGHPKS